MTITITKHGTQNTKTYGDFVCGLCTCEFTCEPSMLVRDDVLSLYGESAYIARCPECGSRSHGPENGWYRATPESIAARAAGPINA